MKTAVIVTAFPLRDDEDLDQLGTAAADAVAAAVGKRDGEGFQVLTSVSDLSPKITAQRAARSVSTQRSARSVTD